MKPVIVHFCTDIDDVAFGPLFDSTDDARSYIYQNVSQHVTTKIVSREIPSGVTDLKTIGYDPVDLVRK